MDGDESDVCIGYIAWEFRYKSVTTVDELYPGDSPADNARWYKQLHQPTPHNNHGNTKYDNYSNNFAEDKMFCNLCFTSGVILSTVHSSEGDLGPWQDTIKVYVSFIEKT